MTEILRNKLVRVKRQRLMFAYVCVHALFDEDHVRAYTLRPGESSV